MPAEPAAPDPDPPFPFLRCFTLVVGNARSGSTMLGAALDAHPRAVVANETPAIFLECRRSSRRDILGTVLANASAAAAAGRPSADYTYQCGLPPEAKRNVLVAGSKAWNPALLLMHGDPTMLPTLEERVGVPVRLVHAIRNPFDVIATMHRRSGATIADRIRWYFIHCEAAAAVRARLPPDRYTESHLEDLLADPGGQLRRLGAFLGLPDDPEHVAAVRRRLFDKPRRTAGGVAWTDRDLDDIRTRMEAFDFLARYRAEPLPEAEQPDGA